MSAIDERESLIKEFETTQDMIKHYDTLNLHVGIANQTSVFILIGLAFGLLGDNINMFKYLFPVVILLVCLIDWWSWSWFRSHGALITIKIRRILEIEKALGWRQFQNVNEFLRLQKRKRNRWYL